MTESGHRCVRFRHERRAAPWRDAGLLREREVERVAVCGECGRLRSGRYRKVVAVEREGRGLAAVPDACLRELAGRLEVLFRGRKRLRAGSLLRRLDGVRSESDIETLAASAPLRLVYHPKGGALLLHEIQALDPERLGEISRPGAAARRRAALAEARSATEGLTHPAARAIGEMVAVEDVAGWDERVLRSLAALARLIEAGETRSSRIFSTEVLGHSKALSSVRPRLERLVGPLERLGIRDSGVHLLVGGKGRLRFPGDHLDVERFRSLGLAEEDVLRLEGVRLPAGGLLVVENLTPFHACLGPERDDRDILVVWSAGYPGRGVTRFVELAAAGGGCIRVWCDVDLGGVRIARLIHRASGGRAVPILMDGSVVRDARIPCPLTRGQRESIERDLVSHPDALLAETLSAILETGVWVEQESMIDRMSALPI
jgi:hypothetical protein